MAKIVVVTHTDLDGVAAAAIYTRLARADPDKDAIIIMTEPYKLHKSLENIAKTNGITRVAIMDLGPNADTISTIIKLVAQLATKSVRVEWYDHHRWDNGWIESLKSAGARMYIDVSTCSAGVVAKYAPVELGADNDSFNELLAAATCAADLWKWDHPLAPKLYRVVGRYKGAYGDKWRREILRKFHNGVIWWPELDNALSEYLQKEFEGFKTLLKNTVVKEVNGCRIVFVLKKSSPPNASVAGNTLLYRFNGDIAVIVRARGKGVSFRSKTLDVQSLAYKLGGGGHMYAAGAPLKLPLLYRIFSIVYPKLKLRYAVKVVSEALESAKICPTG